MEKINKLPYKYPLQKHNEYFDKLQYKEIYLENSWLLVPSKLLKLIEDFIVFKKIYGSDIEKKFYENMQINQMIVRLFKKRPLSFVGGSDSWVLRDNTDGFGHWETIGTNYEKFPLILNDYMSYDEIELSSFLSISIFTPFINTGSRENCGLSDSNCQTNGIYIGQNGARFEKFNKMEWRYMIIDKEQNTKENGYGLNSNENNYLKIWAKFYDIPYFPLFEEVCTDKSNRYYKINDDKYLDLLVYKKRIKINAEVFLREANNRAKKINKKAFCHVVGLGLGAWKISKTTLDIQTITTIEAYLELLKDIKFKYISDIYFSWFNIPKDKTTIPECINNIKIHTGYRDTSEKLNDSSKILIANWAWDPNSYIGNEYWCCELRTSGDPAAACSSYIAYLGNPDLYDIKELHHIDTNS